MQYGQVGEQAAFKKEADMPGRYALYLKRGISIFCVFIMILVGLSACQQTQQTTNTPGLTGTPIKIGTSLSLTGDFSPDGKNFQAGYQIWARTVNASGGLLGRPVQLVILDDKSDPNQAAANYKKLITVDKVDQTFGPYSTLLTLPASDVAHQYGYALLEGAGGAPKVFQRGLDNVFDVSLPVVNNLVSAALLILSLPAKIRPKTAAYATGDDPFTQPQVDLARSMLEKGGVRTVLYKVYPSGTTNYKPISDAVMQSGAQVDFFGTLFPEIVAFVKAFEKSSYNPQMIVATAGPGGSAFLQAVGVKASEGIFVPNGWYPTADTFQNARLVHDYLAQYGGSEDTIDSDVAEAFSVGQVAQQAINKIHSLDNKALIQELHSDTFNTVQGTVKFDATGKNIIALPYLFQWQHGALLPVFPGSVAAADPEFPRPNWP
jgi:branched-chain amino acid transport system substrate-binding protein